MVNTGKWKLRGTFLTWKHRLISRNSLLKGLVNERNNLWIRSEIAVQCQNICIVSSSHLLHDILIDFHLGSIRSENRLLFIADEKKYIVTKTSAGIKYNGSNDAGLKAIRILELIIVNLCIMLT